MDTNTSEQIFRLRQQINNIVDELVEQKMMQEKNGITLIRDDTATKNRVELEKLANKLLHTPTMQLRQGRLSENEMEDAVIRIERQLRDHCYVMHL